jgi:hypothetical protein
MVLEMLLAALVPPLLIAVVLLLERLEQELCGPARGTQPLGGQPSTPPGGRPRPAGASQGDA